MGENKMANGLNRGWIVVFAGLCINLMFGSMYTWSIFSANLSSTQGWTGAQASMPYTTAIMMFAAVMLIGGKLQDKLGPRIVATAGGVLTGLGLFLCSVFPSLTGVVLSFGVMTGAGIGLGYSAAAPAAVKWFKPEQKGLIVGLVVTGFGLAPLYVAPLTKFLIADYGVFTTFKLLGVAFGVIIICFAQLLTVPQTPVVAVDNTKTAAHVGSPEQTEDYDWKAMIKTPQFVLLWLMFLAGSMTGLMLIGHIAKIAKIQVNGFEGIAYLVMAFSITNALGRPGAGFISDKLGRGRTMAILYLLQGATLLMFSGFDSFATILVGAMIITFSYGAMLAVYPSAIGDFYGTKNMGFNYAILFTAWGVAGWFGPQLAGYLLDTTGGYETTFMICAVANFGAAAIGMIVKSPKALAQKKAAKALAQAA